MCFFKICTKEILNKISQKLYMQKKLIFTNQIVLKRKANKILLVTKTKHFFLKNRRMLIFSLGYCIFQNFVFSNS